MIKSLNVYLKTFCITLIAIVLLTLGSCALDHGQIDDGKLNTYEIVFVFNDAEGNLVTEKAVEIVKGEKIRTSQIPLIKETLKREGYEVPESYEVYWVLLDEEKQPINLDPNADVNNLLNITNDLCDKDGKVYVQSAYRKLGASVTFFSNGGTPVKSIVDLTEGDSLAGHKPADPTKVGYTFVGWFNKELTEEFNWNTLLPKDGIDLYAKWEANDATEYVVEHYLEQLDGTYELEEAQELFAATDELVSAEALEYVGFAHNAGHAEAEEQGKVLADGSLVLKVFYSRNEYTVTFDAAGGVAKAEQTYKYGETLELGATTKTGYTFLGWLLGGKELELDTMPAQDLELVADWMEGVGVQYKVEHYFEALDGSYVKDAKVETKVGKTGELVSAKVREVAGFEQNEDHKDALEQATILADGSLVLKVFYSRIEYTVSFDANGGSAKAEQVYKYGQTLALGETTKVGYTFVEWLYEGNQLVYATMPAQDLELAAKWTPNQDTLYSVEHYFEQLDGSYKLDAKVDELQAATEAKVTAVARVVEGFTHNPEHKDAYEVAYVLADGSLVLEVYYTRNEYTVSFDANGGVAKAEQTYLYGEELDLGVTTRTGYTFAGWAPKAPTTMPAEDLEFVAQWTANTNTAYKVQHYFEQLDGSYKLDATVDSLQGTTDTTVKAVARTVAGFTHEPEHANAKESANLNPDGSLVLSVYYSRNTYTLTINVDGVKEEVEYLFEEAVEAVASPEKTGYTFAGWSPKVPATMPAEDVEVVAEWTINQYTLTINIDGVKEEVVYDYNEAVEAIEDPEKTGYTFAGWSPVVPATMPAEDVEVVAEWTINQYQISFDLAGGYFKSMDEFADEIVELFKNSDEAGSKATTKENFHVNSHPNIKGVYNKAENLAAHKWLFEFALAEITANCKANSVTEHVAETTEMLERMISGDTTAIGDSYINGRSIFRHFIHNLINNNHESAGSTGGAYLPYTTDFSLVENQNRALAALNELVLTFVYNEKVVLPANPEKVGYTFAGWDPKVPTNMPAEDVELTATWTINQYTLTTNVDGVKKEIEYDYNETIVTPEAPTKVGYTFAGWKPAVPTNMPAQDVEVVAQWESIAYNISYDLDGANPLPFYNSYEEAVADFLKDYNTARGKSHTVETFSSLGSMTEIGAASLFLYNATYKAKWSWLVNYIATIAGSANKTAYQTFYNYNSQAELNAADSDNIYCIAYELRGWVGQIKYTKNGNFVTADYSQESIKSGCEALLIPTQYNVDSDTITLPTPVKAYHTFLGWFDEADNKVTEISKGSTGNIALTAKWQVNSYTFKYTIDGVEKEVEYNYGATIEKPANPTKVGYTFTGWSVAIPDTMPGHNIETEAQFTINSHNFTYVIDGVETTKSYQYGETIEYPANPSKAGYTFESWVGDKPVTMPDNDVIITAEFEVITYTITYNLAGGTNHANNPATYTVEDEITLLAPTKTDYDFLGWFDEEDQLVSVLNNTTGNLVLTARWDQNAYAISYDLNGGSWKEEEGAAKYSSLLGYELPLLVKEGYTFNGWYENSEFTGDAVTAIEIGTEGPKSFYAKFTIITYTVTFDSNEGSAVADQNINHGSKVEKPADPTRNGYAFIKWQLEGVDYDFETAVTGDLELTAVWEIVTYAISYELNGGSANSLVQEYNVNTETFALPVPTRANYTFAGWYTDEEFTSDVVEQVEKGSTTNLELFAKWIENANVVINYVYENGVWNDTKLPDVTYSTYEEFAAAVLADFSAFKGTSYTADELYNSTPYSGQIGSVTNFFYNNTYYAKWSWILKIVANYTSDSNKSACNAFFNYSSQAGLNGNSGNHIYAIAYELRGLVAGKQYTQNSNFKSADYSSEQVRNALLNYVNENRKSSEKSYNDVELKDLISTRAEYEFAGWYTDSEFTNKVDTISVTEGSVEYNLYAKWNLCRYYISYDMSESFEYDSEYLLKSFTLTRYLTYNGNGIGNALLNNAKPTYWYYIVLQETQIKGLYKIAEIVYYNYNITVDYDLVITWFDAEAAENAELANIYNNKASYVGQYLLLSGVPIETSSSCAIEGKVYSSGAVNGNFNINEYDSEYLTTESVELPKPVLEDYIFGGWYTSSDFTGDSISKISIGSSQNYTLYAKWIAEEIFDLELSLTDETAIDVANPTLFVKSDFEQASYRINGNKYKYGQQIFTTISDALAVAQENDVIYVFAGTYSDSLTISIDNITIVGPNVNIKGTDLSRGTGEAEINSTIKINANNVTLNGIKLAAGSNVEIAGNKATLTNIYSVTSSFVAVEGCNRNGIIYTSAEVSNVEISDSYFNVGVAGGQQGVFVSSKLLTSAVFKNNYFTHEGTNQSVVNEAFQLYATAGKIDFINNDFVWITDNWTIAIGSTSTDVDEINIIDNSFDGRTVGDQEYYTCGLQLRKASATSVVNVIHNTFGYLTGTIISGRYSVAGSIYNIKYNSFIETSYRQDKYAAGNSNLGAGTFNYEGNYYAKALPSGYIHATDYGVITSVDALEAAYAAYKASLLG